MTTKNDKPKFLNPNLNTLEPYVPGKQINDSEYLKLNTNENPFGPSPRVKETIIKFLENSEALLRLYPEPESDSLREVIAKNLQQKVIKFLLEMAPTKFCLFVFWLSLLAEDVYRSRN